VKGAVINGQILWVNLSSGMISKSPALEYNRKFLGGRGVNYWLLLKELPPEVSAFDPENVLVFGTGALVGTQAPGANRLNVASKNPLTGGIGAGSAGGYFAPELRFSGYDHLVIQGKAEKPVYLWINDDQVEIRDATHIWGKTTWETESMIKEELGKSDIQVVCIGPAGENLVRAACIVVNPVNSSRAIGRCGLGAVMGSKKLKAIVVKGTGAVYVDDERKLARVVNKILEKIDGSSILRRLREYGTIESSPTGAEPVRNFQDEYPNPKLVKKINGKVFHEVHEVKGPPCCFNCPIECGHSYRVIDGPYAGVTTNKLEANTLADFGYRLDVDYAPAVIKAHALCSQYGLDIDNSSAAIAWAFECYQRGIISPNDADGLKLEWGNHQAIMELLRKMAYREGFGDLLAEGCYRASQMIGKGSERYCVHVKGQELMEGIRPAKGWALGVVVSERGGTHTRGAPLLDVSGIPSGVGKKLWGVSTADKPAAYKGKAKIVVYYERFHAVLDSLGICYLLSNWIDPELPGPDDYAELFSAATGVEISSDSLMEIGERIHTLGKIFNIIHAGFTRQDDYPPERLMEEPIKTGPFAGELLNRSEWDKVLDEYYELHNWDKRTGWPTQKTLESLDLANIEDLLKGANKSLK